MRPRTQPSGMKGFDVNRRITAAEAVAFQTHGYGFVARYIRRAAPSAHDLTPIELRELLDAGLMVTLVQHVAPEGWTPNETIGKNYGDAAVQEACALAVPFGIVIWCDLEGVLGSTPHEDVIKYCNAWYDTVNAAGFVPGLYVGDRCGLTADELFHALKFQHYWSAYNLNMDQYPAVRGVQMRQSVATPSDLPASFLDPANTIDINHVWVDALGSLPVFISP